MDTETKQTEELLLRSQLGRWRSHDNSKWYLIRINDKCEFGDSRIYKITHSPGSYRPILSYAITKQEVIDHITVIRNNKYVQTEYIYPELQELFRDDKFVTLGMLIEDAWQATPIEAAVDPMQAMIDSLK